MFYYIKVGLDIIISLYFSVSITLILIIWKNLIYLYPEKL